MQGTCYLCGMQTDVAELPSGSFACLMCIYLYLSESDEEPASVFKRCIKPAKTEEPLTKEEEDQGFVIKDIVITPVVQDKEKEEPLDELVFDWLPPVV